MINIRKFEAATGFKPTQKCWESLLKPAIKEQDFLTDLDWIEDFEEHKFEYLLMCYNYELELKKRALRQARHIKHSPQTCTIKAIIDMLN